MAHDVPPGVSSSTTKRWLFQSCTSDTGLADRLNRRVEPGWRLIA